MSSRGLVVGEWAGLALKGTRESEAGGKGLVSVGSGIAVVVRYPGSFKV